MAAGQGDLDKVRKLVDKGADINIKDHGSGVSMCDSSISTADFSLQTPKKGTLLFSHNYMPKSELEEDIEMYKLYTVM